MENELKLPLHLDLCRWILWISLDPLPSVGLSQSLAIEPFLWCTLDRNSVCLADVSANSTVRMLEREKKETILVKNCSTQYTGQK